MYLGNIYFARYKSIFDSDVRLYRVRVSNVVALITTVTLTKCAMERRGGKIEIAQTRDVRIADRKKRCLLFQLEGIMREKKKRFVSYVPGKLSPPPVTNCRTKKKRKKSYLVKIQLAALHAIRSPLIHRRLGG